MELLMSVGEISASIMQTWPHSQIDLKKGVKRRGCIILTHPLIICRVCFGPYINKGWILGFLYYFLLAL